VLLSPASKGNSVKCCSHESLHHKQTSEEDLLRVLDHENGRWLHDMQGGQVNEREQGKTRADQSKDRFGAGQALGQD